MKNPCLSPLLVLLAGSGLLANAAEDSAWLRPGPPLEVQRFSWSHEKDLPTPEGFGQFRADTAVDPTNTAALLGMSSIDSSQRRRSRERKPPTEVAASATAEPVGETPVKERFRYAATIRNPGGVPVRSIVWDYVFRDPESRRVIARVRFRADGVIKPGRAKRLEGFTSRPPGHSASVSMLQDTGPGVESVEIERVVFADNSVWQRR